MNWGKALAIFIGLFMVFILQFVWRMQNQNIDLVAEDYYAQELGYEKTIQHKKNGKEHALEANVIANRDSLVVSLSANEDISDVEALLYNTANKNFDVTFDHEGKCNRFAIEQAKLNFGAYTLKLSCKVGKDKCYLEKRFSNKPR